MKKNFPFILSLITVSLGGGVLVAHAQGYTPLAPLPGTTFTEEAGSATDMVTYLSGAIKLLVAVAGAVAVLMAVIGGTQYVAAGISPDAKSDAKNRITNAFIGLALILTSYLILNSINPNLVAFKFKLKDVTPRVTVITEPSTLISTETSREEGAVRSVLTTDTQIKINSGPCETAEGRIGCTNVRNLNGKALTGVKLLDAKTCSRRNAIGFLANNCFVLITGGTEYGVHQTHGDGTVESSTKLDLHKGDADGVVDNYIKKNGVVPEIPCGIKNAPKYQPDGPTGGTYVDEGNHWHVCYD